MTTSAIGSALQGLTSAQDWFDRTASAVAQDDPGVPSDDLVGAIVQSHMAADDVEINASMLHTAMDTEQSLIDVFA